MIFFYYSAYLTNLFTKANTRKKNYVNRGNVIYQTKTQRPLTSEYFISKIVNGNNLCTFLVILVLIIFIRIGVDITVGSHRLGGWGKTSTRGRPVHAIDRKARGRCTHIHNCVPHCPPLGDHSTTQLSLTALCIHASTCHTYTTNYVTPHQRIVQTIPHITQFHCSNHSYSLLYTSSTNLF